MTKREENEKNEKLQKIEHEKLLIEENRVTLEQLREREKENKNKAKMHWETEVKREKEFKKKQQMLESQKMDLVAQIDTQ